MAQQRPAGDGPNGRYDIAVIGAGSAGFAAAIAAAERGARVALIGHGILGGTCVNVGCVPSKALIRAAESLHLASAASRFAGIRGRGEVTDWAATVAQKDELVAGLRRAKYAQVLSRHDRIAYLDGRARLAAGGVAVNGAVVAAPKVVVATGARPSIPDIPGIDDVAYLTSTTALALDRLPASLLVVGGGPVGCELGQMFARLGVVVTIACRSRLLPGAEPEIGEALAACFRQEGMAVECGVAYRFFKPTSAGVALGVTRADEDDVLEAEQVLLAAGRSPNVESLGLAEAGVEQTAGGAIRVDDRMRTTRAGTYAAGDVTGRDPFVYMAAYGAGIAAHNALDGDRHVYDATAMPAVVFTDPQAANVGLTEARAREAGLVVKTSVLPLDQVPRALAARDTRGLIKLVADARTDRLLGAHILAPEGGDSIQTAALAVTHRMTVGDLAATVFPYLTTVEGLRLAAQAFERDMSRLPCCVG